MKIDTKQVMAKFDELQEKLLEDARDIKQEQDYYRQRDDDSQSHQEGVWYAAHKLRTDPKAVSIVTDYLLPEADPKLMLEELANFIDGSGGENNAEKI